MSEKLKETFITIGQKLPEVWEEGLLSQPQKKALLRCLIEKIVLHRLAADQLRVRAVWKGGQTTTLEVPTTVGAFADLSGAQEMEKLSSNSSGKADPTRRSPGS